MPLDTLSATAPPANPLDSQVASALTYVNAGKSFLREKIRRAWDLAARRVGRRLESLVPTRGLPNFGTQFWV